MPATDALQRDQIAELFLQDKKAFVNYLMRKVKCPDAAQDLSQEAYLRRLGKDSLPLSDNQTGYLFRTAERLSIDFIHQRSGAKPQVLDDELACPLIHPEDVAILNYPCARLTPIMAGHKRKTLIFAASTK